MSTRPHSAIVRLDHRRDRGLVGDRSGERNRRAASRRDFGGHGLGRLLREIVDHHARALARQEQRVLAAQPAARAGDDGHAPVERVLHFFPF